MDRKEEIKIIIKYLKDDISLTVHRHKGLLEGVIIKNGKLLEYYRDELNKLENK